MRRDIGALAGQRFDVAIVGGGIHGAWIALRAARAGCRVALLERGDFGSGTSANSLKILHGGLRYLQHLDFSRMRASTAARREYARALPHLFEPLPCVMPLDAAGLRSPWMLGPALLANDAIAFDRNAGVVAASRLPRGRLLSAARSGEMIGPLVQRPRTGALWWDGIARDASRLVLETLHSAVAEGAVIANHAPVERILHASGRVHGVAFTDGVTGHSHELIATSVVNAAGPWAGALARSSSLGETGLPQAWTGALNVVLRRSLGNSCAVALSSPHAARDRRELFFVPWQGRTMIGTEYLPVESVEQGGEGPPRNAVADFMAHAAALAPAARITASDLALAHWGLMPLERVGDLQPRKSALILADAALTGAAGLVTVIAEKLTSAPQVSTRVLAHLPGREANRRPPARSSGADVSQPAFSDAVRVRLQARYGDRWRDVPRLTAIEGDPPGSEALHAGSAVLQMELRHGIEFEMAQGLADLLRRAGLCEAGYPGRQAVEAFAEWGVTHAGWHPQAVARDALALEEWFRRNGADTRS